MTKNCWTLTLLVGSSLLVGCSGATQDETTATGEATPTAVAPETGQAPASSRPAASRSGGSAPAASTSPAAAAAPAPARPPAPQWQEVTVPAGTALALDLMTPLSSETAAVETQVRGRLRQAVVVDGRTAIPAGAILTGNVTDVARAGRVQGRSRLVLRFTQVELDGSQEDLRTNPIAFEGEATKSEDATKVGIGAGAGAIIGGIVGGGKGAAEGAAIGGGAGAAVVLATRGREVTLAAGANLAATLAMPFTARIPAR